MGSMLLKFYRVTEDLNIYNILADDQAVTADEDILLQTVSAPKLKKPNIHDFRFVHIRSIHSHT